MKSQGGTSTIICKRIAQVIQLPFHGLLFPRQEQNNWDRERQSLPHGHDVANADAMFNFAKDAKRFHV